MRRRPAEEKGPLELAEEAFHLLRRAPGAAIASYYLGTLPFILGLLYFWSDMARSAFAYQHLMSGTLGMTFLFVWMKGWQSVCAGHLLALLCGDPQPRWTLSWVTRTMLFQAMVQPSGLFALPLSLALLFPLGWAYAFYSSTTVLSGIPHPDTRTLVRRAWRQTVLWQIQNHNLMVLLALFGMFVFFNLYTAVLGVPFLLDRLLGIETVFTRSPWAAMNSTLTAAVAGLSYLCLDPVAKAVYVLRCFYGDSVRTGQDLKAELRAAAPPTRVAVVALLCLLAIAGLSTAWGAEAGANVSRPDRKSVV